MCGWLDEGEVRMCLRADAGVEGARWIMQLHCSGHKIKAKLAGPI